MSDFGRWDIVDYDRTNSSPRWETAVMDVPHGYVLRHTVFLRHATQPVDPTPVVTLLFVPAPPPAKEGPA